MKLAVFYDHIATAARQRGLSVSEALNRVREMGYSMVEIDLDALNGDVYALISAAGLELSSIYCFFRFEAEPQKERIRSLIDSALLFGAKRVMPIPGFWSGQPEAQDDEFARMLEGMKELTEQAAQSGLIATIEDFDSLRSPISTSRSMNEFIRRLPHLYATFDTGNFRLAGEDEFSAFDALKDRIAHVHLKDRSLSAEYGSVSLTARDGSVMHPCPVGSGFIPMKEILAALTEIGYDGVLSVEHFGADDQMTCMEKSAEFVRTHAEIN